MPQRQPNLTSSANSSSELKNTNNNSTQVNNQTATQPTHQPTSQPISATSNLTVLMMAAGTGGHVFPALAVAEELTKRGATVHWLGTPAGMENDLVKPKGYPLHPINMQGLRGKGIGRLLKLPFTLSHAVLQALKVIRAHNVDVVVGFGGYVTAPGGIAAKLTGKPLLIHEQNAIAGMSNRYLSKIATQVMQAFDNTFAASPLATSTQQTPEQNLKKHKVTTVGNPVRQSISDITPPEGRFHTDKDHPLKILVVGGSLGAQALNETLPQALALIKQPCEVKHQCGRNNQDATQQGYQQVDVSQHQVTVMPFIDDMAAAYAWADVIVCRAGALTVTEIQNVGLPAIFVPLPHAVDDHQTANARYLADADAAYLIPQKQLTAETLKDKLLTLTQEKCLKMAQKGRSQANPQSTKMTADIIWQYS